MKLNGISLNIQHELETQLLENDPHEFGDDHRMTGIDTPMREGAFILSNEEKKQEIERELGIEFV